VRTAIFGAGGVGGYFGGLLAQAGHEVSFIARGEHLRALQEAGLRVNSVNGDFTIRPARATDTPAEIGPVDYVVVAVKQYSLREAAPQIRPLVGPETTVVPLLNGVDAHQPEDHVDAETMETLATMVDARALGGGRADQAAPLATQTPR